MTMRGAALTLNGRAYFDVEHQASRALTIQAGDFQVHDIGTRFTVATEDGRVEIEVASGALSVSSPKLERPISLVGGRAMIADGTSGTVRLAAVDAAWVGSWRTGKLHFDNTPLTMVARDISRYSGKRIIVDPAIAGRTFSGVIVVDDKRPPAQTLADIMALDLRPIPGAMRLQPRPRP
jgi:transmembrane sensor